MPRAHLDDYLDFQLIVLATAHPLAHLPTVCLDPLLGARAERPLRRDGFSAVTGLRHSARARLCAVRRGFAAQKRRGGARQGARALRSAAAHAGPAEGQHAAGRSRRCDGWPDPAADERGADQAANGAGIRSTREGAFAPFTQQPALRALLLPFGGYGGVQLVEYLINLKV